MEEHSQKSSPAQSLITDEHVKEALYEDKGKSAQLVSWNIVNFTKSGDNYASTVTAVEVKYSLNGQELESSYVVKLNLQRPNDSFAKMNHDFFLHESEFYLLSLPELNGILTKAGQPELKFPRCFYRSLEENKQQIYFEDLRKRNFRLFDRKKGMDVAHATLVLKELARLHATSLLLKAKASEALEAKQKYLQQDLFTAEYSKATVIPVIKGKLDYTVEMLRNIGGYERALKWVEGLKPRLEDIFKSQTQIERYNVICHGDCWNNNMLFRYDSDGSPVELMFVDLQACRKASFAVDLNHFLYTSTTSDVRRPNLSNLFDSYYESFRGVMEDGHMAMPFSREDLMSEFRAKNTLGAMFGMVLVPMVLMESEDIPDRKKIGGDMAKMMEEISKKALTMLDTNPVLKPRFLSIFDEFMETGLIE